MTFNEQSRYSREILAFISPGTAIARDGTAIGRTSVGPDAQPPATPPWLPALDALRALAMLSVGSFPGNDLDCDIQDQNCTLMASFPAPVTGNAGGRSGCALAAMRSPFKMDSPTSPRELLHAFTWCLFFVAGALMYRRHVEQQRLPTQRKAAAFVALA
jgi:hypothetical protein